VSLRAVSAKDVKTLRERSRAGILDCQKALKENDGDMEAAMEWLKKKGIAKADKKSGTATTEGGIASYVHFNSKLAVLVEVNCQTDFVAMNSIFKEFCQDVAMQIAANPTVVSISADEVPEETKAKEKTLEMAKEDLAGKPDNIKEKIVEGRLKKKYEEMALMSQKWLKDEDKTVDQVVKETIAKLGENLSIRRFVRLNLGEGLEKQDADFAAGVEAELAKYKTSGEQPAAEEKPKEEKPKEEPKAEEKPKEEVKVSAKDVKELRTRSSAAMLDCKKALAECGGDMEKAMDWLKKKGMAKADKKAGTAVAEGAVASYVHFNSKTAVLVEVNSQTDFVAMNAIFKEFAQDLAMQIAANPDVKYVSTDEVDAELMAKEKEIEMAKEDLADKPENIREKIVEGRLNKKFADFALMGQKWLKDEDKTVEQVLKERIAKLGENIVIRRFERLNLGEGLEKEENDFAAGVEAELAKFAAA
jgi:elongation factor Ts